MWGPFKGENAAEGLDTGVSNSRQLRSEGSVGYK